MPRASQIDNNNIKTDDACWDVIVVGAGPAGLVTAMEVAKKGARVLVIEQRHTLPHKFGESLPPAAVSSISYLFGDLTTHRMAEAGMTRLRGNRSSWASSELDEMDFYFSTNGHGLSVNRARFDRHLSCMAEKAGSRIEFSCRLLGCSNTQLGKNGPWEIEVSCGTEQGKKEKRTYKTRYIVDASGRRAVVAQAMGVVIQQCDQQFAFACTVNVKEKEYEPFTYIEAVENGWWYSQLLPSGKNDTKEHKRVFVFHTDKDLPDAKTAATVHGFFDGLRRTQHVSSLVRGAEYEHIKSIRGACAASQRLMQFAGERWLAVGDATMAFDPLSSQGITKAIDDGMAAAYALTKCLNQENVVEQNHSAFQNYAQQCAKNWVHYVEHYQFYYQNQNRWPHSSYWSRRQNLSIHSTNHKQKEAS